jgi:hypothetical protein
LADAREVQAVVGLALAGGSQDGGTVSTERPHSTGVESSNTIESR